jgi:hypothetical protein
MPNQVRNVEWGVRKTNQPVPDMPQTLTIFGDELPVLAELGQGFFLVRCLGTTLAIGKAGVDKNLGLLSNPNFESEAVPESIRRRALSEINKLNARGITTEVGV